ncbi:MAG: HAD-IIA family hydrolase [Lachnospiraceae bacterium]|nr:HAD-IIA family hydrolase [Lachnospiraceae bacterium]
MAGTAVFHKITPEENERLAKKKLWILDMDGTVYLGNRLFPETVPFLARIKERGASYIFYTNNASRSKETYVKRLTDMGIPAGPENIMTSAETILGFLTHERPGQKVYLVGTEDLMREFRKAGVPLYNDDKPPFTTETEKLLPFAEEVRRCPIVVASFDTTVTYEKLDIACRLLRNGAEFFSTHPDFNCPVEGGFIPDSGAICAFITASTRKVPRYFGKPYKDVVVSLEVVTGLSRDDMVVVGDRLYTDIALGAKNGMDSVLVLSGESAVADLAESDVRPAYIADTVGDLLR